MRPAPCASLRACRLCVDAMLCALHLPLPPASFFPALLLLPCSSTPCRGTCRGRRTGIASDASHPSRPFLHDSFQHHSPHTRTATTGRPSLQSVSRSQTSSQCLYQLFFLTAVITHGTARPSLCAPLPLQASRCTVCLPIPLFSPRLRVPLRTGSPAAALLCDRGARQQQRYAGTTEAAALRHLRHRHAAAVCVSVAFLSSISLASTA